MIVWESELIHYRVEETKSSLIIESLHNLLERIHRLSVGWRLELRGAGLVSYKEYDSTDYILIDLSPSVRNLLTLLHRSANVCNQVLISCPRIVFKIFSQIH